MCPSLGLSDTDLPRQPIPSVPLGDTLSTTSGLICPYCARAHNRKEDTERHLLLHLPPCIYCSQSGCNWNGRRRYALLNHLRTKHSGTPVPEREEFIIYDAKPLVKQLLNHDITTMQAANEAQLSFRRKAVEMGKLGLWRE
jgi:hypothetical protein